MLENKSNDNFQAITSDIGLITEKANDKIVSNWA